MKLSAVLAGFVLAASAALASAHVLEYRATLNGPSEAPSNTSPGSGQAVVTIDADLATMRVQVTFAGLTGTTTASHIHCCTAIAGVSTAGVATTTPTFTGFPPGVTSGAYDHLFDLTLASSYNPAFITAHGGTVSGAMNALLLGLGNFDPASNKAYLNIHTSTFPGGEIRGFLHPVPEPETYALLLAGLGLLAVVVRRRMTL